MRTRCKTFRVGTSIYARNNIKNDRVLNILIKNMAESVKWLMEV